jgi:hypothetical protein
MAFPSKNRRKIVVDGHEYYWLFDPSRLSGRDAYIGLQSASGTGAKLLLRWVGLASPRFVADAIRFALPNNWTSSGNKMLEIGCDSFANPTRVYLKPANASAFWFHDWWHAKNPGHAASTPLSDYRLEHWKGASQVNTQIGIS